MASQRTHPLHQTTLLQLGTNVAVRGLTLQPRVGFDRKQEECYTLLHE
jgi:hypothetical protein